MEWDHDIQRAVEQALKLQASGSWRTLEHLGSQATGIDPSPAHTLLAALCVNPLQEPEKGRDSLSTLASVAPRSACALALGRSLLALAQEQILTTQLARAETTIRQALACSVAAAIATELPISAHLPDQLFVQAGALVQTLASQLDLELARQREQLPAQLVLVLGMHRSGTSALSGLLVESGLDGPADLMPANPNNLKGYFESLGVVHLNDQLLADFGSRWCSTAAIPETCWATSAAAMKAWRSGMLKLLYTVYPRSGRALIKDPRLCILLRGLQPWLESNLISCVVFLPVRHPAEVVESLWVAESIPRNQGLILWLRHVFESERHSRGVQSLIVPYHQLISDPDAMLRRCNETMANASRLDGLKPLDMFTPARFIDPQLHRQHHNSVAPDWVLKEQADTLYTFALQVYSLMVEKGLPEQKLQIKIEKLWAQWRTLQVHSQTFCLVHEHESITPQDCQAESVPVDHILDFAEKPPEKPSISLGS